VPQAPILDTIAQVRPDLIQHIRQMHEAHESPGAISRYLIGQGVAVSDEAVRRWLHRDIEERAAATAD